MFDSHNGDVLDAALLALSLEVVVNLSTAADDLLDLIIGNEVSGRLLENTLESETALEVFETGVGSTVLKKLL